MNNNHIFCANYDNVTTLPNSTHLIDLFRRMKGDNGVVCRELNTFRIGYSIFTSSDLV